MSKGKELAEAMANFVNSYSQAEKREFVNEMLNQHRTLQQSSFKLIMMLIEAWSKTERYDDRNLATKQICGMIMECWDDENPLQIPFI